MNKEQNNVKKILFAICCLIPVIFYLSTIGFTMGINEIYSYVIPYFAFVYVFSKMLFKIYENKKLLIYKSALLLVFGVLPMIYFWSFGYDILKPISINQTYIIGTIYFLIVTGFSMFLDKKYKTQ